MRGSSLALFLLGCASSTVAERQDAAVGSGADSAPPIHDAAASPDASFPATLDGNRSRLLATYFARLQSIPTTAQSNGLIGNNLTTVCDLWAKLDPSSHAVFLTITHRLDGATLAVDGSHALDHVTRLYRVIGGQGATSTSAGSCGGGEYNRMIMAVDHELHDIQVTANTRHGATPYDLADITATSPLGRIDVSTVVDPYALEMDQDYDCVHNSNPGCDYVFYGPACAPSTPTGC